MFYRAARRLFLILAAPLFRFRVTGAEGLPPSGGAILVAGHRSWLDPACVAGACRRPIRFLIRHNVYHKPWARWFYRRMGGIPVRAGGSGSVAALRSALRVLQRGEILGVFPEGRVVPGGLGRVHPGAAMLSVRAQVPVIPLHIRGSDRAWPHGKRSPRPAPVSVRVGEMLMPPRDRGREAIEAMSRRIEARLGEEFS